jgi:hypothetical protein
MHQLRSIVINTCFGGFSLSDEALVMYAERKGLNAADVYWFDIERDDYDLIHVVRTLGEKANGAHARLKIVEIPADVVWFVKEYDGAEHIAEAHRTWG